MSEPSTIGVRELNQRTSAVLKRVQGGERITVTEHGKPVAYLVPVQPGTDLLDSLVAAGQATAPTRTGPVVMPPDWGDAGVDVAAELVAARDEERW
ncbi:type II toxin-antitoxin system Phd/YefM family antitoxin [Saccharothrix luteola]|uniref:type II toxin-antitoxin system Phd/YefM family antitoxin n=1 Tax=Saccharothrix luteola TaxID=2893018 RepID=UPI001E2BCAC3|nr:type II toxin-antitoxin system prevent-host-death family antitoxin [Saccharothrix luteola]MCC8247544.1 type II toxin-antitoxin system prevent-host-death family antitoxin [Saccharothrix luteola]